MFYRIFSILLLLPAVVFAQQPSTTSMPGMNHPAPTMISGKDHPELIPDLTAYHMYFIVVGELPNTSEKALARQKAHLGMMHGMAKEDTQSLTKILGSYKLQWTLMVNEYNARVDAIARIGGTPLDATAFLRQRDQLVQQYLDVIRKTLSPAGMSQFEGHIQEQKAHMQITAPEGQ
jgi:hypothetical protein